MNAVKNGDKKVIDFDEEMEWDVDELDFEVDDEEEEDDMYENEWNMGHIEKFVWNMPIMEQTIESLNNVQESTKDRGDINAIFPEERYK